MSESGEIVTKHAGGRPLKFKTVDDMQPLIDAYFSITPSNQLTITGLAMALDTDRTTLINYENRDQFFDTIKRAKTKVENAYELSLRARGSAGDIFGLKNFGWKDQQQVENTHKIVQPILNGDSMKKVEDAIHSNDSDEQATEAQ